MDTLMTLLREFGSTYLLDDKYIRFGKLQKDLRKIKELEELLTLASEKLALYRANHSGEYVGGAEYQGLQNSIEKALKEYRGER